MRAFQKTSVFADENDESDVADSDVEMDEGIAVDNVPQLQQSIEYGIPDTMPEQSQSEAKLNVEPDMDVDEPDMDVDEPDMDVDEPVQTSIVGQKRDAYEAGLESNNSRLKKSVFCNIFFFPVRGLQLQPMNRELFQGVSLATFFSWTVASQERLTPSSKSLWMTSHISSLI